MLHLSDITLVVLAGNHIAPSEAAIGDVLKKFSFDDIIIFADQFILPPPGGRVVVTPFSSVEDATRIAWREIFPRLKTSHILSMHWDGYPVRPEYWNDDFRQYDFIGAVWPWFNERAVGNTGFSLQSKHLLESIQSLAFRQPEDVALCRHYRPQLEQEYGIKYAPVSIADRFSIEHGPPHLQALGFHGLWNMLYFMDDEAIRQRLGLLRESQWHNPQIDALASRAMIAGRRELYRWVLEAKYKIEQK